MPISFSKAAVTTWTSEHDRTLPANDAPKRPRQRVVEAGGGQVQVADFGSVEEIFNVRLRGESESSRDLLLAFLADSGINYSDTFTVTWEDATTNTVRFWPIAQGIDYPMQSGANFDLDFSLRKEIT